MSILCDVECYCQRAEDNCAVVVVIVVKRTFYAYFNGQIGRQLPTTVPLCLANALTHVP